MGVAAAAQEGEALLLSARIFALCSRLMCEDAAEADLEPIAAELREALSRAGREDLAEEVQTAGISRASRVLRGDISPYETGYEPRPGAPGGKTFQLADIAGFYRAFGFEVKGERPDHIVPELEFMALLLAKEAYATLSGEDAGAEVCRKARESFLSEHLLVWLPQLGQKLAASGLGTTMTARAIGVLLATARTSYR